MRLLVLASCLVMAALAARAQTPDDVAAALEAGRERYLAGDHVAAAALWQPLVAAGDARAMYNMATLYRRGLGVAQDEARADALLRDAAGRGFAEAQYALAVRDFEATGADEAQRQQAVGLWLAAARQGHAAAQYRLGLLYWNGEAVARDLVEGRAWMALAATAGLDEADDALVTMDRYLDDGQRARAAARAERLADEPAPTPDLAAPAAPLPPATSAAPTPAKPAGEPAANFARSWRLQLAAFHDVESARAVWQALECEAPDLVAGLAHRIVSADLGARGVWHRLQVGPWATREAALRACEALKSAGRNCFLVAPGS